MSEEIKSLIESLLEKTSKADKPLVNLAIETAINAHQGQKRASGESYITHCILVADILAEMKMDGATIAAGILHDIVEDTNVTHGILKDKFGLEVANLVDGVTKMAEVENLPYFEKQAINLRKTIQAMLDDVRVVVIKLADRLHNMRTLDYLSAERKIKIARETMDIFVPLSHRLGLWVVKTELEDLCFQHINPDKYTEEKIRLESLKSVIKEHSRKVKRAIQDSIRKSGIQCEVDARWKNLFSVFQKHTVLNNTEHLTEVVPEFFIIVATDEECYSTLGIIHKFFQPISNELIDYIANPKDNMYRSLHTKVLISVGEKKHKCRIIIRTLEMDNLANYGIVAYWKFSAKKHSRSVYESKVSWLRAIVGWMREISDASDFISAVQSDLFKSQVYVLSPEGDTYEMPSGSTPLDFAYVIHTQIGHGCRGAILENHAIPLNYKLQDGDQIKILTGSDPEPLLEWLSESSGFASTAKSRQTIRRFFKHQSESYSHKIGKHLLDSTYQMLDLNGFITKENLAMHLGLKNLEDLYIRLGRTEFDIENIIKIIDRDIVKFNLESSACKKQAIKGIGNCHPTICQSCAPQPPDQIVGLLEKKAIFVHRVDCKEYLDTNAKGKRVLLEWGGEKLLMSWEIEINVFDRDGLLSDILKVLAATGTNITYIFADVSDEHTKINVKLSLPDLYSLHYLLVKLTYINNVISLARVGNISTQE